MKTILYITKLVVVSIVLFGVTACSQNNPIVDDGYKSPYIRSVITESIPINDSDYLNDVVQVYIENSHKIFNQIEFTFTRRPINNREINIHLKSLRLRQDNVEVSLDSVKVENPGEMIIYYGATPYILSIDQYRFIFFVSVDSQYSVQMNSTK
jgi:hypothetical protein